MNRPTRVAASVAVTIASITGGIVGARSLSDRDDDAPPAAVSGDEAPPPLDDSLVIPMLAPVAVGSGPSIVEDLINNPPAGLDEPSADEPFVPEGDRRGDLPPYASAEPSPAGPAMGDAPASDDPGGTTPDASTPDATTPDDGAAVLGDPPLPPTPRFTGEDGVTLLPFELPRFDPCAGPAPRPDTLPPPSCPDGWRGTIAGDGLGGGADVPGLNLWLNFGHSVTGPSGTDFLLCPADTPAAPSGAEALTLASTVPLAAATVSWRPRGSSESWQTLNLDPPTTADHATEWQRRFEGGTLEPTNALILRCFALTRASQQVAYEAKVVGTDIFGRTVESIILTLPDLTPEGRPPSVVLINDRLNQATMQTWTNDAGSVRFAWAPVTDPSDIPPAQCEVYRAIEDDDVNVSNTRALPTGIWDPQYSTRYQTTVTLPTGGAAILCATIFDSDNTFRPLATETFVVRAPQAQRPRIELVGVRLDDGVTLTDGLSIWARYEDNPLPEDGCSTGWVLSEPITSPGAVIDDALWDCPYTPVPVDDDGYVKVPITVQRRYPGEREYDRITMGIPIQVDDCIGGCPYRPDEYYELPIPLASRSLRGCVFDCGSEPDYPGAMIVKVTFPIVGGRSDGSSQLIASSDRGADPVDGAPRISTLDVGAWLPTGDSFFNIASTYRFITDRPVRVQSGRLESLLYVASDLCPEQSVTVPAALTSTPVTDFSLDIVVPCPSDVGALYLTVIDADGDTHEVWVGDFRTPLLEGRDLTMQVEFLGAAHEYGYVYQFEGSLEGEIASGLPSYAAWDWSDTWEDPSRRGCALMNGTTVTSREPVDQLFVTDLSLGIWVSVNITSVCDGSGSGRGAPGLIEVGAAVPLDQLEDGVPIVLTTPADSPLQLRVTVVATDWLLT